MAGTALAGHPNVVLTATLSKALGSQGGAVPLVTPGEAAVDDRAMRRILLGPLVAASVGKRAVILVPHRGGRITVRRMRTQSSS